MDKIKVCMFYTFHFIYKSNLVKYNKKNEYWLGLNDRNTTLSHSIQ